jgi:hypothetical protein
LRSTDSLDGPGRLDELVTLIIAAVLIRGGDPRENVRVATPRDSTDALGRRVS